MKEIRKQNPLPVRFFPLACFTFLTIMCLCVHKRIYSFHWMHFVFIEPRAYQNNSAFNVLLPFSNIFCRLTERGRFFYLVKLNIFV